MHPPPCERACRACMSSRVEVLVVGAGVVGLAVARELARRGKEVLVADAARTFGSGTSSRNSEVIHAGIYYSPGSLKARACVQGKQLLYDFCAKSGVQAEPVGKLIVSTSPEQMPLLHALCDRAAANGVRDLRLLDAEDVKALEPEVQACEAIFSPSTGILDSHGFMLALLADAEEHGATLSLGTRVTGGAFAGPGSSRVQVECGGMTLDPGVVVNAAGLQASSVARVLGAHVVPETFFAKGNYYRLEGVRCPFSRLVYPVPEKGGLGVHATIDLGRQVRFGPDVEWTTRADDYSVDPLRADAFYAAVRTYWPFLPDGALRPDYCGIRPKLHPPEGDTNATDFVIHGPETNKVPNLVSLFGIESPGLTSSMYLASLVADKAETILDSRGWT